MVLGVCLVALAGALLEASSEKQVAFPTTIPTEHSVPRDFLPVSVRISRGPVGRTTIVGLRRGGEATVTASSTSSEGFVDFSSAAKSRTSPTATNAGTGFAGGRP